MPTNKSAKSPFTQGFNAAVKRGTPAAAAVQNIAKRAKKTPAQVFQSLFKAGQVKRQKIAGQWVYYPVAGVKSNATVARKAQGEMWQAFVDWAIASGHATPERISANGRSSQQFISFMKKYFGRQFNATAGVKTKSRTSRKRATSTKSRKRAASAKSRKRTTTAKARKTRTTASQTKRRRTATKRSTGATRTYRISTARPTGIRTLRRAA